MYHTGLYTFKLAEKSGIRFLINGIDYFGRTISFKEAQKTYDELYEKYDLEYKCLNECPKNYSVIEFEAPEYKWVCKKSKLYLDKINKTFDEMLSENLSLKEINEYYKQKNERTKYNFCG